MSRIRVVGLPGNMACIVSEAQAFPGESFGFGLPEAIGDTARTFWFGSIKPDWREMADGAWRSTGRQAGELSYTLDVVPGEDTVDIRIEVCNESDRVWAQSHAFNCINCGGAPSVADHECRRHWVGMDGSLRRLIRACHSRSGASTRYTRVKARPFSPGASAPRLCAEWMHEYSMFWNR